MCKPTCIDWRYKNPWRPFCSRWWKHWFSLNLLWYDIEDAVHRAFHGWSNGDIWDLEKYHLGVTLGLLEHFRDFHDCGAITSEDTRAKLNTAIGGIKAKLDELHLEGWNGAWEAHDAWQKQLRERWQKGYRAFLEIYDDLWV